MQTYGSETEEDSPGPEAAILQTLSASVAEEEKRCMDLFLNVNGLYKQKSPLQRWDLGDGVGVELIKS